MIRKPFTRRSGDRNARLIVIATEGEVTEPTYFYGLIAAHRRPSIHVELLERIGGESSPAHIQVKLDNFVKKYQWNDGDELWMVIDRDRWTESHLAQVARQCNQKGYFLAISVPCFELWLLLHVAIPPVSELVGLSCTQVGDLIRAIVGKYNKTNLHIDDFIPHVHNAIERSRSLDTTPSNRWPQSAGTRVYLLAEKIITDQ
jgi:hypothetical protein